MNDEIDFAVRLTDKMYRPNKRDNEDNWAATSRLVGGDSAQVQWLAKFVPLKFLKFLLKEGHLERIE